MSAGIANKVLLQIVSGWVVKVEEKINTREVIEARCLSSALSG